MKNQVLNLLGVCLGMALLAPKLCAGEPAWENIGGGHLNAMAILVDPKSPRNIFLGTRQGIFFSTNAGKNWRLVLSLKGQNRQVGALAYGSKNEHAIYAATGDGLFFSADRSSVWKKIFQGRNSLERDCRALAITDERIYLGTKAGLFVSLDQGKSWLRQSGVLGHSRILAIAADQKASGAVYAASVEGLFKTGNKSQSWEKLSVALTAESDKDREESFEFEEEEEDEEKFSVIKFVAIDPRNSNRVYLALNSGVLASEDFGRTWRRLTDQGLLGKDIKAVSVSLNSRLYCVSGNGVFLFQENSWQDLSVRLVPGEINSLYLEGPSNLLVAASKGLFILKDEVLSKTPGLENSAKTELLIDEPAIAAVQQAAMRFAEVEPEKIKNWRRLAAKKAWLPQMSLGFNRQTTDLWHWESGSTVKDGDDNLRKGHDSLDWDISLSWDLGDIVWSEVQNSIDVRSRLSVQLRNDILDEVTKLYFERIRVKAELRDLDILEKKKRLEKELRIRELNAYLDGLTGGYFSRNILGPAA
jgi:photosystem II stability/assembly factor-like uncharacterized protein